jgi:hypothetical protein
MNIKEKLKNLISNIKEGTSFKATRAYAPVSTKGEKTFVEKPDLKRRLIDAAKQQYSFTKEGSDAIEKVPFNFAVEDMGRRLGYYSHGSDSITLPKDKYTDPGTTTHEFTHSLEGILRNNGTSPLYDDSRFSRFWENRKNDWGEEYMNKQGNDLTEREAVLGTERPTNIMTPEQIEYYSSMYNAGEYPERVNNLRRIIMGRELKKRKYNELELE